MPPVSRGDAFASSTVSFAASELLFAKRIVPESGIWAIITERLGGRKSRESAYFTRLACGDQSARVQ